MSETGIVPSIGSVSIVCPALWPDIRNAAHASTSPFSASFSMRVEGIHVMISVSSTPCISSAWYKEMMRTPGTEVPILVMYLALARGPSSEGKRGDTVSNTSQRLRFSAEGANLV